MTPGQACLLVWGMWGLSWLLAAAWSDRSVRRLPLAREMTYRLVLIAGIVLLFGFGRGAYSLWPAGASWPWAGVVVTALGFMLCWWARLYLGRLWSADVARKEGHRIVDTGPYRLVRHPIYTGIILAGFATAFTRGSMLAFLGAAVMAWAWWRKARLEEQFLRAELGAEAYDAYAARTKMLVPFIL